MQKGSFIFFSLRLAFCIAALCSGASWRLGAATVVVSSLGDSGIGSLRAAISAANPGDTVTFAVAGTITLTSGELLINKNLDINGLGGGVTVQRSLAGTTPNFRIFNITAGTVNILYLNMANGSAVGLGGAVQSAGSLTLVGCVLSGNKASVAGGGLAASGPTTVTGCTVWGNTANAGGGIYNDGTMIVNNTTIYRNSAEGVENGTGSLTLLHCTVSSNTNGVWNAQLIPGASIQLDNTIIAGNTDPNGVDVSGPMVSQGYNLIGRTNNPQGTIAWQASDKYGSSAAPLDARLGPLEFSGGLTPALPLLSGSPALDAGTGSGLVTDQREYTRPRDLSWVPNASGSDGSDIGALEMQATNRIVTTLSDSVPGSLRAAIAASSLTEGDYISFAPNVVGTIVLSGGELAILGNLQIAGPGVGVLSVSGNNASRIFSILDGGVSISGLTIRDGRVIGSQGGVGQNGFEARGGGIYNQSTLWLASCVISNNTVVGGMGGGDTSGGGGNGGPGSGGGILNISALSATDCLVISNKATGGNGGQVTTGFAGGGGNARGGGIYSAVQSLSLERCMVDGNTALGGGGGLATGGGEAGNGGQGYGGALYNDSPATLSICSFSRSAAQGGSGGSGNGSGSGGGIFNNSTMTLAICTIADNTLGGSFNFGGGVYDQGSGMVLRSCTVAGNTADYGGGLYVGGVAISVGNSILAGNTATSGGPDASGNIQSTDYNLVQDTGSITFFGTTTHNVTGTNPLLGALRNNGGTTLTMALLTGSPAIDKGRSFGEKADQRGKTRPFNFPAIANASGGDASDIGAFEVNPPILSIAPAGSTVQVSWSTNDGGYTLEGTTNLVAPSVWLSVGSPSIVGDQFRVIDNVAGKRFYRLRTP